MKIYISGKITGDRRYKAKFREVEKKLAAAGHIVLNPATVPEGLRPVDYMRLCFAMMEAADVVLFMQDYQDSRGAYLWRLAGVGIPGRRSGGTETAPQGEPAGFPGNRPRGHGRRHGHLRVLPEF